MSACARLLQTRTIFTYVIDFIEKFVLFPSPWYCHCTCHDLKKGAAMKGDKQVIVFLNKALKNELTALRDRLLTMAGE